MRESIKRLLVIMLSLTLVFTMMPMIPGADHDAYALELLPAPTITIDANGVATWTPVEGAFKYSYSLDGDEPGECGGGWAYLDKGVDIQKNLDVWNEKSGPFILSIYAVNEELDKISEVATISYNYTPSHTHILSELWSSNETHHWHECLADDCPLLNESWYDDYEKHNYVGGVCVACNKKLDLKDAPTITLDEDGVATWTEVEGAAEYAFSFSNYGGYTNSRVFNCLEYLTSNDTDPGMYTLKVYAVDYNRKQISEESVMKYDYRMVADTFVGTSEITAPVYGKEVNKVYAFYFSSDVNANVPETMGMWELKNGKKWQRYEESVFREGTYRYVNQLRLDSTSGTGSTHKLADSLNITINGKTWGHSEFVTIFDEYSYVYMYSPEYVVYKIATDLTFTDNSKFDINEVYQNRAIEPFSVAKAVVGGTEPYVFSKMSGPSWITVSEDGTISGTPSVIENNTELVVRVTDDTGEYAAISIAVANTLMNPDDRTEVDTFAATSTFCAPVYGGSVTNVYDFEFTSAVNAYVPESMGGWYKKIGEDWVKYTASTFGIGEYFYENQLRLDSTSGTGSTHKLAESLNITINGEEWTHDSDICIFDKYSYVYMKSPVYVVKKPLPASVTLSQDNYTYDGEAKLPEVTVADLTEGVHYTVTYIENVKAGTATVLIKGIGDYCGEVLRHFTINPCPHTWNSGTVTKAPTCTTTGVKTYTCTVPGCGETKTETIAKAAHSYSSSYTVDKKATLSENGSKSKHCSKCSAKTSVTAIPKVSSVSLSSTAYTYNGKAQKPSVTVKNSKGTALKNGTDYSVSYASGRTKIGRYKVTVTLKGAYSGSKTLYFTVGPKNPSSVKTVLYGYDDVKVSWSKVSGASGYQVYYKKSSASSYKLLKTTTSTSYKKSNLDDGVKYDFKVVVYKTTGGDKCYNAGKTSSITTLKKVTGVKAAKSSSKVKVSWTNIGGETGYQISQSTSKSKTNVVATYKTTSGKSKTISATKGKTYYYKVRAYKVVDGKKIYGPWSSVVKYKR